MSSHVEERLNHVLIDETAGRFECKHCGMISTHGGFAQMPLHERLMRIESFRACHGRCRRP